MTTSIEDIAHVVHEANRAWCITHGDFSQHPWGAAADWQKASMIAGVRFHIDNPDAGDSASHDAWCAHKRIDGWVYGFEKSAEAKTHPCLVPFQDLPHEQQMKDRLARTIIHALSAPPAGVTLTIPYARVMGASVVGEDGLPLSYDLGKIVVIDPATGKQPVDEAGAAMNFLEVNAREGWGIITEIVVGALQARETRVERPLELRIVE